jgi:tetratricopeptide (TPR) repeat protein
MQRPDVRKSALVVLVVLVIACGGWLWLREPEAVPADKLFREALTALDEGRVDNIEVAQAALDRFEADRRYWRHLAVLNAVIHLRRDEPQEAYRELADEPMDSPVREYVLLYVGEALYRMNQLGQAQQVFEQLLADYPDNTKAVKWLGAVYYDLGAYDAAITQLVRATELKPEEYGPWHLLGVMYNDFEATEDAVTHLTEALKRDPPAGVRRNITHELAAALIDDRQYDQALQTFDPSDTSATAHALRARAYWSLSQSEPAAKELALAEQQDASLLDVRKLRAEILEHEGRAEDAIELLRDILQEAPDSLETRYQLAIALKQAGQTEEAEQHLQTWQQQRTLADELIEKNLQAVSDPSDAEVRDRLAEICRKLGRDELALMWERAAAACRQRAALRSGSASAAKEPESADGSSTRSTDSKNNPQD